MGQALGNGDTVPLGRHAASVLGSGRFPALVFSAALRSTDMHLGGMIEIDGDKLFPRWSFPSLESEFAFLEQNGGEQFMQRVSESEISIIFDPARPSVV